MVLLDTCTVLMLGGRQEDLSRKAVSALEKNVGNLYVSTISSFEIVLKHKLGKLELPLPPDDWYLRTIKFYEIAELAVTSSIAMRSADLPFIHKDPCDRIIAATSLEGKMRIVTPDETLPRYPGVRTLW